MEKFPFGTFSGRARFASLRAEKRNVAKYFVAESPTARRRRCQRSFGQNAQKLRSGEVANFDLDSARRRARRIAGPPGKIESFDHRHLLERECLARIRKSQQSVCFIRAGKGAAG